MNEQSIDLTKFPEGPQEIIKHMDYMPDDDAERMQLLIAFMMNALQA